MRRHILSVAGLVVAVGVLFAVSPARAIDPVLQEAQLKLVALGYHVGLADGLYGPRTRQAIEAFQRKQQLPATGVLDAATLQALDRATASAPEEEPAVTPEQDAPLRTVLTYLRFYTLQPARILPYVTEDFRAGRSPQEWLDQTLQLLAMQEYAYLEWKVQRVEVTDAQATVEVQTRVRAQQQEQKRQEIFNLRRTTDGVWLINEWHTEALPPAAAGSQTGS